MKFRFTISGQEADHVMEVINAIGVTKEEFSRKAVVMMAQDIALQATKRMEAKTQYEADRQTPEVKGEEEKVQPPSDSREDTEE